MFEMEIKYLQFLTSSRATKVEREFQRNMLRRTLLFGCPRVTDCLDMIDRIVFKVVSAQRSYHLPYSQPYASLSSISSFQFSLPPRYLKTTLESSPLHRSSLLAPSYV